MYTIYDIETTIFKSHKRTANPFDKRNWIVAAGWKHQGDKQCSHEYRTEDLGRCLPAGMDLSRSTLLVGFNIKFDLLYVWRDPRLIEFFKRGGWVWDCQYVEYLLSAQHPRTQRCNLSDLAPQYGGTKKIDAIKELWKQGVQTNLINRDLLLDYLIGTEEEGRDAGDIGNTEKIFLGQVQRVAKLGMGKAIRLRMDGLCATTEMEYNGLKINVSTARRNLATLLKEEKDLIAELDQYIPKNCPKELGFSWANSRHLSAILYGGTIKYEIKGSLLDEAGKQVYTKATEPGYRFKGTPVLVSACIPGGDGIPIYIDAGGSIAGSVDVYLSGKKKGDPVTTKVPVQGKPKTKIYTHFFQFPKLAEPDPKTATKNLDGAGNPVYQTTEDALECIPDSAAPWMASKKRLSKLGKEIGTYYVRLNAKGELSGMLTCVQPEDHIVHHSINHTRTVTTRLSGENPNSQNFPRKENGTIKQLFVSRFGDDGVLGEVDYSQVEVIVQAVLSGDLHLQEDIRQGIDFHCKRVSAWKGCTYDEAVLWCKDETHPKYKEWKPIRTAAKVFSFQRAYGAGAKKIAATTGMAVTDVEALIAAEEAMYPDVTRFNNAVIDSCERTAKPFFDPVFHKMYRRGYWQAPTGCLYSWRSYDAPDWLRKKGIQELFSPPETKNYPTQGTAAEFMQATGGLLWRHFLSTDNYGGLAFLTNTVHDCNWTDMHKSVATQCLKDVQRIMQSIPELFNRTFGMNITVPFKAEAEAGPDMYNLSHPKESY